jgi:hypothetical protein
MANTKITSRVIADNSVGIDALNVTDGTNGQALVTDGSGGLSFASVGVSGIDSSADATAITIDSSENVGIGQASDGDKLHVLGTGFFEDARGNGVGIQINGGSVSEFAHIGVSASNPLTFQTADTERMRIDSAGNVGIGTDNPGVLFHVQAADGDSPNNYVAAIQNLEATAGQSFGLTINAGSNASDIPLNITTADTSSTLLRLKGSGELGLGSGTTYSSSLIATDIGTRDFTIYSTSSDAGNYIVLTDNSSSANISYGTEGNTHILRADTTNRLQADSDGIKVFGDAAGASGARVSGRSKGEQLARQYCARTGGSIRYVSAGSGSINSDVDAINDGDAILMAPGSYTITRTSAQIASNQNDNHDPFRVKRLGVFGDTNNPADVTLSCNIDDGGNTRDHPIFSARYVSGDSGNKYPVFLGFIKYVRNPTTRLGTNYSNAIVRGNDGYSLYGGAQNVLFDFDGSDVSWMYDNNNVESYIRFKNCTFDNYGAWQDSYTNNNRNNFIWHCIFNKSTNGGGDGLNYVEHGIASSDKVEQLKGNKHGVSLSSGAYNTTTYAGAGHLYSDQFPIIFWDDREWENGGNF